MDISRFVSHIHKNGIARPNKYRVTIPIPHVMMKTLLKKTAGQFGSEKLTTAASTIITLGGVGINATNILQLMCMGVSAPGLNIDTAESRTGGPMSKVAYSYTLDVCNMTFLCGRDMRELKVLEYWTDAVVDPMNGVAGYYDDYITDIIIEQLDDTFFPNHIFILEDAYPTIISPLQFDATATNAHLPMEVSFAFRRKRPIILDDAIVGIKNVARLFS